MIEENHMKNQSLEFEITDQCVLNGSYYNIIMIGVYGFIVGLMIGVMVLGI